MNDSKAKRKGLLYELLETAASSFFIRAIGIGSTYLFSIFIIREYSIASWGEITLLFSIIQVAALFLRSGMDKETMLKFSSQSPNAKSYYDKSFLQIGLHSLIILGVVVLYYFVFGNILLQGWNIFSIWLGASALSILLLHSEVLRGLKKIGWFSFFEKGGIFTVTAIIALATFFIAKQSSFNLNQLVIAIVILSCVAIFVAKKTLNKFPNDIRSSEKYLESPLKLGYPLMLSGAGFMIMNWADLFIIGAYQDDSAVGLFNVCSRIASLSAFALLAVNTANGPKIAELFQKNETKKLEKYIQHSNKITAGISILVGIVVFLFPKTILGVFGIYSPSSTIIYSLLILVIGEIINASCGSIGLLMQATGSRKQFQRIVFIATAFNITIGILLVPTFGILGGAIANALATAIWNVSSFLYAKKKLGIGLIYKKL